MKNFPFYLIALTFLLSCNTSQRLLVYNFESSNVTDSVILNLKKYALVHNSDYSQIKWFALIRENAGNYELIINENTEKENFVFKDLIKKTNRFLSIDDEFRIPVIFDIDFLSVDFKKRTRGTINFGGYYFKIIKNNGEFNVVESGVLY